MAIVTHVLGDCPGCGGVRTFGNVEVFGGKVLYRGCRMCDFNERLQLPSLHKRIVYLDQFFFSHAFRGKEPRFVEAAARIERATRLQLLAAPYSSIHEDETHQWSGRDELFRFIKAVSRGHKFGYAPEVCRAQLLRAFDAWRAGRAPAVPLEERDALRPEVHLWDGYLRLDVGRYVGDIQLIESIKDRSVDGLLQLFPEWRRLTTSFGEDLQAEYRDAGRGYFNFYLQYVARIMSNDHAAFLEAPAASRVVESMVHRLLRENISSEECLNACARFLLESEHFRQAPCQWLAAQLHATMKAMVKSGKFTNEELARKKFKGYFHDVQHIATYAPYCDAIVIDQAMADLVRHPRVDLHARFGTNVFSLNNWPEFLAWIDSLENTMTPEHRDALAAIHPR